MGKDNAEDSNGRQRRELEAGTSRALTTDRNLLIRKRPSEVVEPRESGPP